MKIKERYKDYFFAMYNMNDNFIMNIEDIQEVATILNMKLFNVARNLRNNMNFNFCNQLVKIYPIEKEEINEKFERRWRK